MIDHSEAVTPQGYNRHERKTGTKQNPCSEEGNYDMPMDAVTRGKTQSN